MLFVGYFGYFLGGRGTPSTPDDEMMRAKGRRRVALAVDDSPNAMRAVRFAARDILDADTDAVLVTCVSGGTPSKEGERVLGHHRAQLLRCGLTEDRVSTVIVRCKRRESTGEAVCKTVRRQDCDHVVLGSRGLSSVQQLGAHLVGLGSVGEHVAHHAHVPVTVVPPRTPVEEMITVRGAEVTKKTGKKR